MFVKKYYLGTNCIESSIQANIDLKNLYRNKNLPDPTSKREAASKHYVDSKFNDNSIMKNTAHADFNDKNFDKNRYIKVNSFPTLEEHLLAKYYVDNAISYSVDESSFSRLDTDEKIKQDERGSIPPNSILTSPKTIIEIPTKNYVDHEFDDPSIIKNTAHVDFNDKNLDNVKFVEVNSLPAVREHLTPYYYVDKAISYWLDELSLLRLDPDEN